MQFITQSNNNEVFILLIILSLFILLLYIFYIIINIVSISILLIDRPTHNVHISFTVYIYIRRKTNINSILERNVNLASNCR